jgi:hypothetical protein
LVLGQVVTGEIAEPGEEDSYTFEGAPGRRIYYDAQDGDNDSLSVQLVSPGGSVAHINHHVTTDVGPFTLTEAGVYTLVLNGNGAAVGDYRFVVSGMEWAEMLVDTVVSNRLEVGGGGDPAI